MLLCLHAAQEISLPFPKDVSDGTRCDARCRAENKEPLIVDVMVVLSPHYPRCLLAVLTFPSLFSLFSGGQTKKKTLSSSLSPLSLSLSAGGSGYLSNS